MKRIRLLLADDHAVLRAGLRMLFEAQPDMEVVAEAADGAEAARKVAATRPDVALMDLSMPGGSGVQAIERIRKTHPATRVLVLTMHDDPAYARAALAAGAAGHLVKDVDSTVLLSAIRAVHRGHTFSEITHRGSAAEVRAAEPEPGRGRVRGGTSALSARERQVLGLLARGHTNREIAERISLSVKTVETYRARLADKLGLRTRADLVRFAIEAGLLE